jgi:SMODS and SLOG-associating 2TM effector domain 3/SMODS and SLOG-associating 2TM effector domain 1
MNHRPAKSGGVEPFELPSLYTVSDRAAVKAQRTHFRLVGLRLAFLLGIAGVSAVSWNVLDSEALGLISIAGLLILMLGVSFVQASRRYDKTWFATRSIAESVKSQAWFYAMAVKPYETEGTADDEFHRSLKRVLDRQQSIPPTVLAESSGAERITEDMRNLRKRPVEARKSTYIQNRLTDQRKWYSSKSLWFAKRESRWFYLSIVLQLTAALLALLMVLAMGYASLFNATFAYFNPVGLVTTAAGSTLAWGESKRFGELSRSYSIVAGGLAELEEKSKTVGDEEQLRSLVSETERSISQEHEVWLARSLRD